MNNRSIVLMVLVCSCSGAPNGGTDGGPFVLPPGAAQRSAEVVCLQEKEISITALSLLDARKELNRSVVTDGEVTVSIGATPCTFIRHTLKGGVVVKTEILQRSERARVTDPATGITWYYAAETRRASWSLNADGTVESGGVDAEADGFDEIQTELRFAQGFFSGRTISVFNNATHQPMVRRTTTRTGTDTVEHREETYVAGMLSQTTTTDAELRWKDPSQECFTRPGRSESISPDVHDQIDAEIASALAEGVACLEKLGGPQLASKLQLLGTYLQHQPIKIHGFSGGQYGAANLNGAITPGATLVLEVNTGMFTEPGCISDNERKGTLFHELLHSVFGSHAYEREFSTNLANPRMSIYSDVVSSCESACFGMTTKTQCACARCLRAIDPTATVCDKRCMGFPTCNVTDPADPKKYVMGPAVGAVFIEADKQGTWYPDMGACKMAHASGCKSKSLSCLKGSE